MDESFSAVITGVEKFGIFCRCEKYPVDGFVHVSNLAKGERLDFDRATYTMTARSSGRVFRMGDRVEVRIALIDPDERTLHWELVEGGQPARRASSKKEPSRKPDSRKPENLKKISQKTKTRSGRKKKIADAAPKVRHKKKSAKRSRPKSKSRPPQSGE
jgi:ribonuclease R